MEGTPAAFVAGDKTAKDYSSGVKKTDGKYWSGTSYPLGWAGNIALIENAFKTYFVLGATLPEGRNFTDNSEWTLSVLGATIDTGATASDLPPYWALLVKAYAKALAENEIVLRP
jgi:hypothetical protein